MAVSGTIARRRLVPSEKPYVRIRFADWDSPDGSGGSVAVFLCVEARGLPPTLTVIEWTRETEAVAYEGSSLADARIAWLLKTGHTIDEVQRMSLPGFNRRDDVPRWLYGDLKDIALRATDAGQDWKTWTTEQWVAHIRPTRWTMRLPRAEMAYYRWLVNMRRSLKSRTSKPGVGKNDFIERTRERIETHMLAPEIARLRKKGQRLPP